MSIPRNLTSLATAAALALVTIAAPLAAAADDHGYRRPPPPPSGHKSNDVLPFIAGAIIGGAIVGGLNSQPRPAYQPARRPVAPGYCAIDVRERGHWSTVYRVNCLQDAGYGRILPYRCSYDVRTRDGWRRVIPGECLRDAGFRLG